MYDLAIIGAGWAGFNAALKAKKLDKKICLIEKDQLGGVCLNRGCIPTKVLIHQAKNITQQFNTKALAFQNEKKNIISKLKQGMEFMLKSCGIDFIKGTARIISNNKIVIKEDKREIEARFILIATGSQANDLTFLRFDHKKIVSSDDMLELDSYPKRLLIVGGGVIGCEFAGALSNLGIEITIIEILDRLLPLFDVDISKKLEHFFKKKGINIKTNYDIKQENLDNYDLILLCLGRIFSSRDIFDPNFEIKLNKGGFIAVDEYLKTSQPNIYAAGDCIGGYQLAHVASFESVRAVDNIFLTPEKIDYSAIPASVFTDPEVAQVGLNEINAKSQNINVRVLKKPFSAIGMAHILKQTDGYLKLVVSSQTNQILGASIIGPLATELINTLSLVVIHKFKPKDLRNLIFAHPSISEIFTEAIY